MKDLFILLGHLLVTIAKLLRPGGVRIVAAENTLLKQQLLVVNRSRRRAPNLSPLDRFLFGFWSLLLGERRIPRVAIILRPSTLLSFHDALKRRKYRLLYTPQRRGIPGPKGVLSINSIRTHFSTFWLEDSDCRRRGNRLRWCFHVPWQGTETSSS